MATDRTILAFTVPPSTAWATSPIMAGISRVNPLLPFETLELFDHRVRCQLGADLMNGELQVAIFGAASTTGARKIIDVPVGTVMPSIMDAGLLAPRRVVSRIHDISALFRDAGSGAGDVVVGVLGRQVTAGTTAIADHVTLFLYLGVGEIPQR
jgi:hypothetical protein